MPDDFAKNWFCSVYCADFSVLAKHRGILIFSYSREGLQYFIFSRPTMAGLLARTRLVINPAGRYVLCSKGSHSTRVKPLSVQLEPSVRCISNKPLIGEGRSVEDLIKRKREFLYRHIGPMDTDITEMLRVVSAKVGLDISK